MRRPVVSKIWWPFDRHGHGSQNFPHKDPQLGNPQIRPPGLWKPPRSTPRGFPSYTQTALSTSTQKGWVSPTKRRVVTPLPDLPETSASPTWVSAAVTCMFHKSTNSSLRPRRTLPDSLPDSPQLISVFTMSLARTGYLRRSCAPTG